MTTVGQRALRGTLWLSAANYTAYVVTFVTDILLARLLFPEDFGTVALAVSVLAIVGRLGSLGLGAAAIQYKTDDEAQEQRFISTVFSLQLIVAASTLIVVLLLSGILRRIYEPTVVIILLVLAVGRGVQSLNQVPSALMQKRMMFRQDALISFLSLTGSSALGVFLAWQGFGTRSLVVKRLSQIAIDGMGRWWVARWRPRLSWDGETLRYVWRFARSMWISGNAQILLQELDDTAVGTLGNASELGYYSRAWKISRLFMQFVAPAIGRTALPTFSQIKGDREALASVFGIVQRFITRMSAGFFLVVGLLTPSVISVLYGDRWLLIVPLFRIMIVYGFLKSLFDHYAVLFIAIDKPHILARVRIAQLALFAPGVFVAAYLKGAMGVAIVTDLMMILGIGLMVWQGRKHIDFSFFQTVLPSLGAALVTLVAFLILQQYIHIMIPGIELVALGLLILLVFGLCLLLFERGVLIRDVQRVRHAAFAQKAR